MPIQSINPATSEVLATFDECTPDETTARLDATAAAWSAWRDTPLSERTECLRRVAAAIRDRAEEMARTMALEMGKPLKQGRGEVEKCAMICEFYAAKAADMLAPTPVPDACAKASIHYEPLGTVLTVMPWNFPYWQVFRIAAPSLAAGNAVVLKHASNVPQCALLIEEAFRAGGLPENIFQTLLIGARQVEHVLDHPSVFAVSLTGSEGAGRKVAAAAAARLKKSVMELGGSDPFIVLEDADLDKAAHIGALARCNNTGQTCIAAKRFIVLDAVYDEFTAKLSEAMHTFVPGDPLEPDTVIGPMSSGTLRQELQEQVDRCVAEGGHIAFGGAIPEGPGFFYPPTMITDLPADAAICQEELFGPVALVFRVPDEDAAIALANGTPYGLGGSIWTTDTDKGAALAARVRTGSVFINGLVRSDPHLPFGGVGSSGYGRELGEWGIREFVNVKSVCVD